MWDFWPRYSISKRGLKSFLPKQSRESLSGPRSARRVLPAEEPLRLKIITPSLSHQPSSRVSGAWSTRGSWSQWAVAGLVSARGETPGVSAGLGVQDLLPLWLAPVCCAALPGLPRSAQLWLVPTHSQSRRPNFDAFRSVCCGRAPARPSSSPAPSVPDLDSSGPHQSRATLLLPAWQPRLPPLSRGAQLWGPKESCGPRGSGGCTPGAVVPTLAQLLAGLGDPRSRRLRHQRTAATQRQEEARPEPGLEGATPRLGVSGCARAVPL